MTKREIIDKLNEKHDSLYNWLKNQPDEAWIKGPKNKWTTGEHIVHLIQSEQALNKALRIPKFYLKYKFSTNNRENRSYPQVVEKYQSKLKENPGVVARISRQMPNMTPADKASYISNLDKEKRRLIKKFQKWNDKDLDTYLLPHPLIGRMTIREIIMWAAYHTEHHYKILKDKY